MIQKNISDMGRGRSFYLNFFGKFSQIYMVILMQIHVFKSGQLSPKIELNLYLAINSRKSKISIDSNFLTIELADALK